MIISVLLRVLKLIITGVLCSSIITLSESIASKEGLFYISFLAYLTVFGIDAYRFSYHFWKTRDYYFGQLIPLLIYTGLAILMHYLFEAEVFNTFFLHFRFAEVFTLKTIASIMIVALVLIYTSAHLRHIGSKRAKRFVDWFAIDGEYTDAELEKFKECDGE